MMTDEVIDQSSQTVQGSQVNAGRDVHVGQIGDNVYTAGGDYVAGNKVIAQYVQEKIIVQVESLDKLEQLQPTPGDPPYKGLAYFTEADKEIFFGRETLTAKITGRLRTERFLAIVGASGSGKSSLLRAGVVPELREQNWLIYVMTPGAHPLASLAQNLTRDDLAADTAGLQEQLAEQPGTLVTVAGKLAGRADSSRLLLLVDQFEELFTLCKAEAERQAFLNNLLAVAETGGAPAVVVSVRADFYDHCLRYPGLRGLLANHQEPIGQMTPDELVRVIAEPAKQGGWQIMAGLMEQILEDVGQEPGRLPLLSHALRETWERRRGTVMTLSGYRAAGGVEGAIAHTAEQTLARLPDDQALVVRRVFLSLTELGEGTEDTRRVAGREELAAGVADETVDQVLEELVAARLVTVRQGEVEVAHEALIRRWPRLHEWLAESREQLRLERQLARDAATWVQMDRDPDALYRGARLAQATALVEQGDMRLHGLPAEFLDAGRELAEREARALEERRQRELEQQRALAAEQEQRANFQAESARRLRLMLVAAGGLIVVLLVVSVVLIQPVIEENRDREAAMGEMIDIPASLNYRLGAANPDREAYSELPEQRVTIPAFKIDKFEVSIGRYVLCVEHGKCDAPLIAGVLGNKENYPLPVTNITAFSAARFCDWIGGRLPSEVEWERAARGLENLDWPWGNEPSAPTNDIANLWIDSNSPGETLPVDSYPDGQSKEAIYNLVGNVLEWTASYEISDSYDPDQLWGQDWQTWTAQGQLIQRGGGYNDSIPAITWRNSATADDALEDVGFRCAADVD